MRRLRQRGQGCWQGLPPLPRRAGDGAAWRTEAVEGEGEGEDGCHWRDVRSYNLRVLRDIKLADTVASW